MVQRNCCASTLVSQCFVDTFVSLKANSATKYPLRQPALFVSEVAYSPSTVSSPCRGLLKDTVNMITAPRNTEFCPVGHPCCIPQYTSEAFLMHLLQPPLGIAVRIVNLTLSLGSLTDGHSRQNMGPDYQLSNFCSCFCYSTGSCKRRQVYCWPSHLWSTPCLCSCS